MIGGNENGRLKQAAEAARAETGSHPPAVGQGTKRSVEDCKRAWDEATPWRKSDLARRFFGTERGLDFDTIPEDAARVCDWSISGPDKAKYRSLIFPLYDLATEKFSGLQVRQFTQSGQLMAKGKNATSGHKGIYRIGDRNAQRIVIVEGQEDALAVHGVTGGATWATTTVSFGFRDWPLVPGRVFVLMLEQGSEEKGRARALKLAEAGHGVLVAEPPQGVFPADFRDENKRGKPYKDANDAVLAGDPEALRDALENAIPAPQGLSERNEEDSASLDAEHNSAVQWPSAVEFAALDTEDGLPDHFGRYGGAIWYYQDKENDKENPPQWVCDDFEVIGKTYDQHGTNSRLVISYKGHLQRIAYTDTMPKRLSSLSDIGMNYDCYTESGNRNMAKLLRSWDTREYLEVDGAGPIPGGGFMTIYGKVIGREPSLRPAIMFKSEAGRVEDVQPSGTLAGWLESVARPVIGSDHCTMAFGIAFAAALIGYLREENRSFHWSGQSQTGKTSLLQLTASTYGAPAAMLQKASVTQASFRPLAHGFSGHCLCMDEMGLAGPNAVQSFAFEYAEGRSAARRDPESQGNRATQVWSGLMMLSGETTAQRITEQGGGDWQAGQESRLIEVEVRKSSSLSETENEVDDLGVMRDIPQVMDRVRPALADQYGTALPAFVRYVYSLDRDLIKQRLETLIADFEGKDRFRDIHRVVRFFALVALALELAREGGVLPQELTVARCTSVPRGFLALWIEQRGGSGPKEHSDVLSKLDMWLLRNGDCISGLFSNEPNTVRKVYGVVVDGDIGPDGDKERILCLTTAALYGLALPGISRAIVREALFRSRVVAGERQRFTTDTPRELRNTLGRTCIKINVTALHDLTSQPANLGGDFPS